MFKRALFSGLLALSAFAAISATVVSAGGPTVRVEGPMTVLRTDPSTGRIQCVEHRIWIPVVKSDLRRVHPGDIVRVELQSTGPARLVPHRSAVEELSSPE